MNTRLVRIVGLSFIGGFVDTVGFIALYGLFTAHVTGNFVLLGAHFADYQGGTLARLLAVPVFVMTIAAASAIVCAVASHGWNLPLFVNISEITLLTAFMICGAVLQPAPNSGASVWVGMLAVMAMGIQNVGHRLIDKSPIATTAMTSNIAMAVIELVERTHTQNKIFTPRLKGLWYAVAAFWISTIIGAFSYIYLGFWCLVAPIAILLLLVMI